MMNNMNMNKSNMNMRDNDDHLYPEVYHHFAPVADQLIKDMETRHGEIYLNEDLLQQMIDEAIRRSNINENMPNMPIPKDDAVPTFHEFGGGRGRGGWRGYDRGALSDIYRILFLQSLFGRRRPFWRWR
jgi:hypothetical protein